MFSPQSFSSNILQYKIPLLMQLSADVSTFGTDLLS